MSHKGYNGRVITMWLGDCMERAAQRRISNDREFGGWLQERNARQGIPWPDGDDERFAPICAAMILEAIGLNFLYHSESPSFNLKQKQPNQILFYTPPTYTRNPRNPDVLRQSLCQWFISVENSPIYLPLGCWLPELVKCFGILGFSVGEVLDALSFEVCTKGGRDLSSWHAIPTLPRASVQDVYEASPGCCDRYSDVLRQEK